MSDFNDYSIGFMNEFRNVFGLSMLIWKIKEKQFKNNTFRLSVNELKRLQSIVEGILEKYKYQKLPISKEFIDNHDILAVIHFCMEDYNPERLYEEFMNCFKLKNDFALQKKNDDIYYDKMRFHTLYNIIELFCLHPGKFEGQVSKIETFLNSGRSKEKLEGEEIIIYLFYKALLCFTKGSYIDAENALLNCHSRFFEMEGSVDKDFSDFFNVRIQVLYAKLYEKLDKKLNDSISAYQTLIDDLSKKSNFLEIYVKIAIKLSDLIISYERTDLQEYAIKLLNSSLQTLKNNERFTSKILEQKYILSVALKLIYLNIKLGNDEKNNKLIKNCKVMIKDHENIKSPLDHFRTIFYSNLIYYEAKEGNIEKAEKYFNKYLKNCNDFYISLINQNNLSCNYMENKDFKSATRYLIVDNNKFKEAQLFFQNGHIKNVLFNNSLILYHHLNCRENSLRTQLESFKNVSLLNKLINIKKIEDNSEVHFLYILYNISIFLCKRKFNEFIEQYRNENPYEILEKIKMIIEKNNSKPSLIDMCLDLYLNVIYSMALFEYQRSRFKESLDILDSFFSKFNLKEKKFESFNFQIAKLYKLKGDSEFNLKYFTEVIESCTKCLSLISKSNKMAAVKLIPSVHFNLGVCYLMKNDLINSEYNMNLAVEGFKNENNLVKVKNSNAFLEIIQNLNLNRSTYMK